MTPRSPRKQQTSQPQDHPAKPFAPRPRQTVKLANGMRVQKTGTGFEVVYSQPLYRRRTVLLAGSVGTVLGAVIALVLR